MIALEKGYPLKDYSPFYSAIKSISGVWWHYLKNSWLVKSDLDAKEIYNAVRMHLHQGDRVLVVEVTENYCGWLPSEAWPWIYKNLG